MINIDELTIGQVKQLSGLIGGGAVSAGLNSFIGQKVIIRTYSAGVWFGTLLEKAGNEVVLSNARRMWKWFAKKGISLSECSIYGVDHAKSEICEAVDALWLEAIEITPCTQEAIKSLEEAPHAKP